MPPTSAFNMQPSASSFHYIMGSTTTRIRRALGKLRTRLCRRRVRPEVLTTTTSSTELEEIKAEVREEKPQLVSSPQKEAEEEECRGEKPQLVSSPQKEAKEEECRDEKRQLISGGGASGKQLIRSFEVRKSPRGWTWGRVRIGIIDHSLPVFAFGSAWGKIPLWKNAQSRALTIYRSPPLITDGRSSPRVTSPAPSGEQKSGRLGKDDLERLRYWQRVAEAEIVPWTEDIDDWRRTRGMNGGGRR